MFRSPFVPALISAALLEFAFLLLRQLNDLKMHVIAVIAVALAAGIVYVITIYVLEHSGDRRALLWIILGFAFVFRLTLTPLEPSLSDDLYRYRWDGIIQLDGWNPYSIAPDDRHLLGYRDNYWAHVSNQEMPNIYPPLTELVLRATAGASRRLLAFKAPMLVAEALLISLLAFWIRRTGRRDFTLAIYAWNPLVVVEIAASGHNDTLAMLLSTAAIFLIIERRIVLSTLALGAAVLAKFFPVLLAPLLLRRAGWPRNPRSWIGLVLAGGLAASSWWPYRAAWPGVLSLFGPYRKHWVNNASLYSLLKGFSGSDDWAWGLGFGIVAGIALWVALRNGEPLRVAYLLFGAIPLLSQNAFSWYFLWVTPLLVFFPNPAWLLLTILQFLSYHVLIGYGVTGAWKFDPFFLWLEYGPFYALILLQAFFPGSPARRGVD